MAPLPNHMYFETDFKVFKMYFQYLNTIFLYFNPIWPKKLNFRPCLKYILGVVKFVKSKPQNAETCFSHVLKILEKLLIAYPGKNYSKNSEKKELKGVF